MGNYSTKHKVILGMAAILLLVVGSALGYLVGSARSDASSAGFSEGTERTATTQGGDFGPWSCGEPGAEVVDAGASCHHVRRLS